MFVLWNLTVCAVAGDSVLAFRLRVGLGTLFVCLVLLKAASGQRVLENPGW